MAGRGKSLEPGEEAGRHLGRLGSARELGLGLGQRPFPSGQVGGSDAHPFGLVLARLLRCVGLALELGDCELSPVDLGLGVGELLLARLDRA